MLHLIGNPEKRQETTKLNFRGEIIVKYYLLFLFRKYCFIIVKNSLKKIHMFSKIYFATGQRPCIALLEPLAHNSTFDKS